MKNLILTSAILFVLAAIIINVATISTFMILVFKQDSPLEYVSLVAPIVIRIFQLTTWTFIFIKLRTWPAWTVSTVSRVKSALIVSVIFDVTNIAISLSNTSNQRVDWQIVSKKLGLFYPAIANLFEFYGINEFVFWKLSEFLDPIPFGVAGLIVLCFLYSKPTTDNPTHT